MRKILLPLVFCLPLHTVAQVSIAPIVGFNMSGYTRTRAPHGTGLSIGVMTDIKLSNRIYLQPGVLYVMNRFVFERTNEDPLYAYTTNVKGYENTVELPVNLAFKTKPNGKGRFAFSAGPYMVDDLSARSHVKITDPLGTVVYDKAENFNYWKTRREKFNVGVNVNIGYELNNGLLARAFGQLGLTNYARESYRVGLAIGYFIGKKTISTAKQPDQPGT